jgi:hypothetical protein
VPVGLILPGLRGAEIDPAWWAIARRPLLWRFHHAFPLEHVPLVKGAFVWWWERGVPLHQTAHELGEASIVVTWTNDEPDDGHRAWYLPFEDHGEIVLGPRWAVMRTFGDARRCNLVKHEIGHGLGFKHTSNPLSLMHPKVGYWPVGIGLLPGERAERRRLYP